MYSINKINCFFLKKNNYQSTTHTISTIIHLKITPNLGITICSLKFITSFFVFLSASLSLYLQSNLHQKQHFKSNTMALCLPRCPGCVNKTQWNHDHEVKTKAMKTASNYVILAFPLPIPHPSPHRKTSILSATFSTRRSCLRRLHRRLSHYPHRSCLNSRR